MSRRALCAVLVAVLFQFSLSSMLVAQHSARRGAVRIDPQTGTIRSIYRPQFTKSVAGSPDDVARAFLRSEPRIGWDGSDRRLRLERARESAAGTHLTYRQYVGDIPVLGAVTKVSLNRRSEPTFVSNSFRPGVSDRLSTRPAVAKETAEERAVKAVEGGDARVDQASLAILPGEPDRLVWRSIVWPEIGGEWQVLIDAQTGDVAQLTEMTLHRSEGPRIRKEGRLLGYMEFQSSAAQSTASVSAIGKGMVFDPDPLATSGMPYGAPYSDTDDAEVPELNAERRSVDLLDISQFADNRYRLAGPFVEVVGRRPVGVANYDPPSELDPNAFNYTRGDERFEGVMAYYHMDRSQRKVQALGFDDIQNTPVPVNPFGEGDADNSNYYLALNFVALGGGGIDDAEDAFVIWHEYAHALLNANVPDYISTTEGRSIHEGWSDYWAASYQRALYETGELPAGDWKRLFRWDGNFSPWFGRQMPDFRSYPQDVSGNFYSNGLVLASAFMGVWDRIGGEITDRLVLQAQYYLTNSSLMPDYAEAVVQADIDLYGGEHASDIVDVFAARGLVDGDAFGPVITHTPLRDTEQIGGSIDVTAEILGVIAPISSAQLTFSVSGSMQTVDMTDIGDHTYVASIPLPNSPAVVEYHIVAIDGQDQEVRFPASPEEVIRFQAGPDQEPPVIQHTPIAQTSVLGWPPVVAATIVDNIGIDSAYVEYAIDDLEFGSRIDEGRFPLELTAGLYSGTFPRLEGLIDGNEQVTYRIIANDYSVAANKAFLPPEAESAFTFEVSEQGTVAAFDFEAVNEEISASGAWELGTPSFGVTYAHSGSNAWATRLNRAYPDFPGTAELQLPPINLAGLQTAWLEFWHWYDIEHDGRAEPGSDVSATLWDGGTVQVSIDGGASWSTVTPEGGYDGQIPAGAGNPLENQPAFGGFSYGWRRELVQIPAGSDVRVRFLFAHDVSNEEQAINYAGWVIDDVSILVDRPADHEAPVVVEEPPAQMEAEAGSPVGPLVSLVATDDIGLSSVIGSYSLTGPANQSQGSFRLAQSSTDPTRFEGRIPISSSSTSPQTVVTYTLALTDFGGNVVEIPATAQPYRVEYVFVARQDQLASVTPSGGWIEQDAGWTIDQESFSGGVSALVLTPVDLPSDAADIRFEMGHSYRLEEGVTAVVEVTDNGGSTWASVEPKDGYPGEQGFSGQSNDAYTVFDLNQYAAQQIQIRMWLNTTEGFGESDFWKIQSASTVFKAEGDRFTVPRTLELHSNFPNPFSQSTTVSFTLPEAGVVTLGVYDALGRRVATILNEAMEAGTYSERWDAGMMAAGTYFIRLTTNNGSDTKAVSIIH